MKTLGGYVCVRNALRLDYCVDLAIKSLLDLNFLHELILCDSDSDDGTREVLDAWAVADPRVRVINWPWTNPKGVSHHAWLEWLNFARQHLRTDVQITLDADEVLDNQPLSNLAIWDALNSDNPCRYFDRLNFWRDPGSLIPEGECCGKYVARMGPTSYPMQSDQPCHPGESRLIDEAVRAKHLKIFHLGFLREQHAFYRKARAVSEIWFNRFDERLEEGEKKGIPLWETECSWKDKLVPYTGTFPAGVVKWLRLRGHQI